MSLEKIAEVVVGIVLAEIDVKGERFLRKVMEWQRDRSRRDPYGRSQGGPEGTMTAFGRDGDLRRVCRRREGNRGSSTYSW